MFNFSSSQVLPQVQGFLKSLLARLSAAPVAAGWTSANCARWQSELSTRRAASGVKFGQKAYRKRIGNRKRVISVSGMLNIVEHSSKPTHQLLMFFPNSRMLWGLCAILVSVWRWASRCSFGRFRFRVPEVLVLGSEGLEVPGLLLHCTGAWFRKGSPGTGPKMSEAYRFWAFPKYLKVLLQDCSGARFQVRSEVYWIVLEPGSRFRRFPNFSKYWIELSRVLGFEGDEGSPGIGLYWSQDLSSEGFKAFRGSGRFRVFPRYLKVLLRSRGIAGLYWS